VTGAELRETPNAEKTGGECPQGGLDAGRQVSGQVILFDEQVGLGEVVVDTVPPGPGLRYPFHCTQISDGSRRIVVGTRVSFSVAAGRHGTWEATRIAAQPVEGTA
jgi:hypothetical protein